MSVELIISFKEGNVKAREEVFKLVYPPLYFYACKLTTDEMTANIIVVDTYLKFIEKTHYEFDNIRGLKNILYKIVGNACKDHLRTVGRDRQNLDQYLSITSDTDKGGNGMEEEERFTRLMNAIADAIPQQPEQRRQVLEYMIEDKSAREIAELMNINKSGVYKHRDAFIDYLHKKEGIDPKDLPAFFDF